MLGSIVKYKRKLAPIIRRAIIIETRIIHVKIVVLVINFRVVIFVTIITIKTSSMIVAVHFDFNMNVGSFWDC